MDLSKYKLDVAKIKKCTKLELNEYLRDIELTADNLKIVEEIEND